jgi:hypothetical protein
MGETIMATLTFDTHESIESLRLAGFEEEKAEALVAQFKKLQDSYVANLATKEDLKEVQQSIKEIDLKFSGELTLIKWMLGFVLAGILSLVLKTFFT